VLVRIGRHVWLGLGAEAEAGGRVVGGGEGAGLCLGDEVRIAGDPLHALAHQHARLGYNGYMERRRPHLCFSYGRGPWGTLWSRTDWRRPRKLALVFAPPSCGGGRGADVTLGALDFRRVSVPPVR
jgi:hypothetical protein